MKAAKSFLILLMFGIGFTSKTNAQTDSCIIKLKNANTIFEQGDYDGSIKLLKQALNKCNLDKEDKIQANKLLILSYLKIDNLEEADKAATVIMKINPNYKPDKFKDDAKLSALFEKYKPTPMFRIGISGGANSTFIKVQNTYSIVHADDDTQDSHYKNKWGFQLGVQAEYRAYKNLWAELGGQFRISNYQHTLDNIENTTVDYKEKLTYFDIPLAAKYYILDKRISPYIKAGATFSFLNNALSTTTRDAEKDLVNRKDLRNTFMVGYFGGAGVAYNIKGWQVFADVRYTYYNKNVNKDGTRYMDLVNVFKYYYIDDDFKMNNLQINAGVNYTFMYKNQKVK